MQDSPAGQVVQVLFKKLKPAVAAIGAGALMTSLIAVGLAVTAGAAGPTPGSVVTGLLQPQSGFTAGIPFASGQQINLALPANETFSATDGLNNNHSAINVLECSAPNGVVPTLPSACDGNSIQGNTILPNTDGSFTFDNYPIYALPDLPTLGEGPGGVTCGETAATECILFIGDNQNDFTQPHLWSTPFFVAPNSTDSGTPAGDGSAPPAPSAPSATTSTVVAAPTTVTADGVDQSSVTVTLLSSGSVPVAGKTVTLTCTSSPCAAHVGGPSPATTNANGQVVFTVTDTVAQSATLSADDTTDTVALTNTATVAFQTPAVDASHSTVVANPTTVTSGGSTTITVTLRDQASAAQPVAGKTVTLSGDAGNSAVITPAATPAVTNAAGQVTFTASDTVAEDVTFSATDMTDSVVLSSTANVVFGTLTVSSSISTVSASSPAPVGSAGTSAVVTLLTATGSPVAGKSVTLTAPAGSSVVIGTPTSDATGPDGKISFGLTDTVAESVTLTATDSTDGVALAAQPTVVFERPAASGTISNVTTQATTSPADGATQTLLTVTLNDQFGNPVSGKTVTLSGAPSGNVLTHPIAIGNSTPGVTNSSGQAFFEVADTRAQTVTFTATDTSDDVIISKTVSITYEPLPADPSGTGTTVKASPQSVPSNGSTPSTITVTLADALSNPIAGKSIGLAALNGSSTISPSAPQVTNLAGQATFTVTDGTAEVVTYQATDVTDGNAVLGSEAVVTFGTVSVSPAPLSGTGSAFASPAISTWVNSTHNPPYNLSVNWSPSNSGTGRFEFTNQTADFAVSDIGYVGNTDTTPPSFPFEFIPIVGAGIAFMYDVPGLAQQLHLSSYTACGLLTGGIKNWNDPAIAADNPGVSLPSVPVRPVTESDSAGTNYTLEEWCIDEQPALWAAFVQAQESQAGGPTDGVALSATSPNSNWPGIMGGLDDQSTTAVASDVANNPGAIGAVQVKYAQDDGFNGSDPTKNVALVKNASGDYTAPSAVDVTSALAYATQLPNGTAQLNFNGVGPHVYNPSTYSYLLTPTTGWNPAKGDTLSQFVDYALTLGQQTAPSFGYASLGLALEQYGIHAVQSNVPGAVPPTAAEQAALACGDLTPAEVAAGQTTPTCGGQPPSFGSGGKVTTDFYGQADGINAMTTLPDGDTLAAGFTLNPQVGEEAALAEYTSIGGLDPTFGSGGEVALDINLGGNSAITALHVDPTTGFITIGGYTYNPTLRGQQSFIARLTPTGSLDPSFGTDGVYLTQSTPTCSSSEVAALSTVSSGDTAALVTCSDVAAGGHAGSFELLGLTPSGQLDPTFGTDGVTALNLPPDPALAPFGQQLGWVNAPAGFMTDPPEDLYVTAESLVNGQTGITIERVQPNGQVDQSFGTNGQATFLPTDFGCTTPQDSASCFGMYHPESITTQSVPGVGPELLIGGQDNENGTAAVLRVLPDSTIDTGFGDKGLADAGFVGPAAAVTIQQDGAILVGGNDEPIGAGAQLMAVARLTSGGQLDTSFGNQGYSEVRFGSYGAQLTSLAVDAQGDYIAAGATVTGSSGPLAVNFALTLLPGSSQPQSALPEAPAVVAFPIVALGATGLLVAWRRRRRRAPTGIRIA